MILLEEHLQECGFEKYFKKLVKELDGKKVVVYGTGMMFELVQKKYDLSQINIIGVSDIKYFPTQEDELDFGYKIIPLEKLEECDADVVLLGVQKYHPIMEEFKEEYFLDKPVKIVPLVKVPFLKRVKDIFFD